ncbi:MAG: S41 family peptidase [Bacteroidota bacterium]
MKKLKKIPKRLKVFSIAIALAVISFASIGFVDNYFEITKNLDIFYTLFEELNIYYVDDTDPGELIKKGIDEMLESLDPYTVYIPESEMEDHRFMITGQYGGIGALIRKKEDNVIIAEPYEGFPAQKADLMAGDILLEVNGKRLNGKNTSEVSEILKGQPGTTVKMLIEREGEKDPIEKILVREDIKIESVPYYGMLTENIGYIKLRNYTNKASSEVKKSLQSLKEENDIRSLVLDVRDNPGGLLREAVNIVNLFVEKGQEIVSTKGKLKEWDKTHKGINIPVDIEIPLVVLVNRSSASASEIVAGSIQDLDRGVIIGQKTFGKGLVQQTRQLSYNAQLKVTTAKYYIPSGRCIQALDYTHRDEDGSVGEIPDSLISEFKTKNGRLVYDGGGIIPDIQLEDKKQSNITKSLSSKYLIFDYATKYRSEHPTIPPPKEFEVSDADYNEFVAFLADKDYDYTTKSERKIKELKEAAIKEKYFEDAEQEYESLKKKINHSKEDDLKKFKDEIMRSLESEIVTRYFFQKGRIEVLLKKDPEIKKAVEVLNDSALYASILDGSAKLIEEQE